MSILDELAGYALERVQRAMKIIPAGVMRENAFALPKGNFAFENALKKPDISFICECKKASPSFSLSANSDGLRSRGSRRDFSAD